MGRESKEDREERERKERESDRKLLIGATSKPAKIKAESNPLSTSTP